MFHFGQKKKKCISYIKTKKRLISYARVNILCSYMLYSKYCIYIASYFAEEGIDSALNEKQLWNSLSHLPLSWAIKH